METQAMDYNYIASQLDVLCANHYWEWFANENGTITLLDSAKNVIFDHLSAEDVLNRFSR